MTTARFQRVFFAAEMLETYTTNLLILEVQYHVAMLRMHINCEIGLFHF